MNLAPERRGRKCIMSGLHIYSSVSYSHFSTLVVLFYLVPQIGAVRIPSVTYTKQVPAPLPTEAWVGKSSVDYNEAHEKYAAVLVCIWIPLGSIGFCYWFSILFVTIGNLLKTRQDIQQSKRSGSMLQACLTTSWSAYAFVQNLQTLRSCQGDPQFDVLRNVTYSCLTSEFLSITAGLLLVAWGVKQWSFMYISSFWFSWAAVCGQWVTAILSLKSLLRLQPPGHKLNILVESVSMPAKSIPIAVLILLSIAGIVLSIWIAVKRKDASGGLLGQNIGSGGCGTKFLIWISCTVFFLFYAVFVGLLGLVFVFLGNVVGSPWGVYFLKNLFGQVTVALTGVVGVVELAILTVSVFFN